MKTCDKLALGAFVLLGVVYVVASTGWLVWFLYTD